MKAINYNSKLADFDCYRPQKVCAHSEKEAVCNLTGRFCVGILEDPTGDGVAFDQDLMERCPMYNLDFKTVFGKRISERIRDVRS